MRQGEGAVPEQLKTADAAKIIQNKSTAEGRAGPGSPGTYVRVRAAASGVEQMSERELKKKKTTSAVSASAVLSEDGNIPESGDAISGKHMRTPERTRVPALLQGI